MCYWKTLNRLYGTHSICIGQHLCRGKTHPYILLKSQAIFHPGYVSVTTEGLPSDHRIRAYCSWEHGKVCPSVVPSAVATLSGEVLEVETFDSLALLASHPHCLRTPAHLTGGGTRISVHHRVRRWVGLPSDKEAEYLRNDFPKVKQKSLDPLILKLNRLLQLLTVKVWQWKTDHSLSLTFPKTFNIYLPRTKNEPDDWVTDNYEMDLITGGLRFNLRN